MIVPHAVLARNWRKPQRRSFKRFLLNTVTPCLMPPEQLSNLQTRLAVIALSWDGVQKALRMARATVLDLRRDSVDGKMTTVVEEHHFG